MVRNNGVALVYLQVAWPALRGVSEEVLPCGEIITSASFDLVITSAKSPRIARTTILPCERAPALDSDLGDLLCKQRFRFLSILSEAADETGSVNQTGMPRQRKGGGVLIRTIGTRGEATETGRSLILNEWNGGLDRTRICDLLRVKPEEGFFRIHGFYCVLYVFNNLGSLPFAQLVSSTRPSDGVLIRF